MGRILGQMVEFMMEIGIMIDSTVKDYIVIEMVK
jgi:hypothetical protein